MAINVGLARALAVSIATQANSVKDLIDAGQLKDAQNVALAMADEYEKLKAELDD